MHYPQGRQSNLSKIQIEASLDIFLILRTGNYVILCPFISLVSTDHFPFSHDSTATLDCFMLLEELKVNRALWTFMFIELDLLLLEPQMSGPF